MSVTNKGKYRILELIRGGTLPTNFYIALCDDSAAPTVDTNTLSELAEIPAGNGYTSGGFQLTPNGTDLDVLTEDDVNDRAFLQIKDVTWTASGGNLPASGTGARYAVLTDDNVTVGDREVWAWWDLASSRIVSSGQPLTLQDCEIRLTD